MRRTFNLFYASLRYGGKEKQMMDVCYSVVKHIASENDSEAFALVSFLNVFICDILSYKFNLKAISATTTRGKTINKTHIDQS